MNTITVDGVEYAPINPDDSPVRIVILQRGWVVVGYWQRDGEDVTITSGKVIRGWGTTAGLGELVDGPTADTVLDPAGTVHAHILGVVASIDAHPELEDTVEVWQVGPDDWAGQIAAVKEITDQARKGDWIVIDSMTPTWLAVRTLYVERRYGDDFFDYFATGKDRQMADADMNWNAINSEYARLYKALFGSPAHVLLTAEADAMTTATQSGKQVSQDRGIRTHYQTIGWKPKGQKTLAYTPHTVIWLNKDRVGDYYMTTAKDRERKELEAVELKDFSRDYLMRVAGWRPVPTTREDNK